MWDARLYDDRHAFVWKHGASLVELLAPQAGQEILDLGCGTGHLTARLAATDAVVLGVDSSPAMIDEARRLYSALTFEVQDARRLPFTNRFDAVFSNAVLHWVPEAAAVATGVYRALRPGGRFVAEFGGHGNIRQIAAALQAGLKQLGIGAIEPPWYYPSIGAYTALLERAGLEVTFATLFDRPTPLEGDDGLRRWIEMFAGRFLEGVPPERREDYFRAVEKTLRPTLCREGVWTADYRRLRVVAWRRETATE
ncbi:MAG: methyltransferase domain-containing protein [Planctomycetia bacterium]|nr:methyltransferase domain-containing protein [Planctomycetia bacterium]